MGKAFVSYFPFSASIPCVAPRRSSFGADIFISQLFQRGSSFIFFSYYAQQSAAGGEESGRIGRGRKSVCSGELNFNLSRVIRALRVHPPAMTSQLGIRCGRVKVTREINNFLLTFANFVGSCVFPLSPALPYATIHRVCFMIWFAFLIYMMMRYTCRHRIFKLNSPGLFTL